MQKLNLQKTRDFIQNFNLNLLFINELGWNNPISSSISINDTQAKPIAELGGISVFEVITETFPNSQQRADIHQKISKIHHENLLIFLDKRPQPTKSIWYWQSGKQPREHYYFRGQPGDLFISKLSALFTDFAELEDSGGDLSVIQVSEKLKKSS